MQSKAEQKNRNIELIYMNIYIYRYINVYVYLIKYGQIS